MNVKIIRQTNSKIVSILSKQKTSKLEVTSENGNHYEYDYLHKRSLQSSDQSAVVKVVQVGEVSDVQYTLRADHTLKFYEGGQEIFEMPVNTLNFSNIIVFRQSDNLVVISVSTTDPDKFDVYRINNILMKDREEIGMERLMRLQGFMEYEIKTGNIMNFEYINNVCFVGYEDGSVIKYILNDDFNKILEMKVVFDFNTYGDNTHDDRDHPVLKIFYCIKQNVVFFTHAKLTEMHYCKMDDMTMHKVMLPENISINHMANIKSCVYFSCWENNFIYKFDFTEDVTVFYAISIKPNIQLVDIDPVADTSEPHPYKDLDRTLSKVSCLYRLSSDEVQKHYLALESKVLMKRYSRAIQNDYLYIGLESGNLIELSF